MYFADLTPYQYMISQPLPQVLNIGWLSPDYPYATGDCDPDVSRLLEVHHEALWANQTRGYNGCHFCPDPYVDPTLDNEHGRFVLGSSELWVPTAGETIFAAPSLVIHYLREHGYSPPAEFVAAVLGLPARLATGWTAAPIAEARRAC
jgi:hypothetical protein